LRNDIVNILNYISPAVKRTFVLLRPGTSGVNHACAYLTVPG
jgi:hypothetical protein